MSKIKLGAIVTDIRGKNGGHVFTKNKSGNVMRTKRTPSNPKTSYQTAVRARLTSLSQGFRALGATSVAAWNSAAKNFVKHNVFGDKHSPSGLNLYVWLNSNLLNVGASAITTPPSPGATGLFTTFTATAAHGTPALSVTFAPTIDSGDAVIIKASAGLSAGKSYVKNQLRQIAVLQSTDTSPKDLLSLYTAKFGSIPSAGQKIYLTATWVNKTTGQAGQAVETSCIVGA